MGFCARLSASPEDQGPVHVGCSDLRSENDDFVRDSRQFQDSQGPRPGMAILYETCSNLRRAGPLRAHKRRFLHETRGSSRGASRVEGQELRFCTGLTTNPEGRGSGQEWRFCTRLAAISAREPYRTWNGDSVRDSRQFHRARARAKHSDSARDSRQIRHSQRVRGRAIHGTRTGHPGMMI